MTHELSRLLGLVERLTPSGAIGDGMVAQLTSLAEKVREQEERPHYYVGSVRVSQGTLRYLQIMEERGRSQLCIALVPYNDRNPQEHRDCSHDADRICAALNQAQENSS